MESRGETEIELVLYSRQSEVGGRVGGKRVRVAFGCWGMDWIMSSGEWRIQG